MYTNSPPTKTGTTNGHWEKTTFDGLGRVIKLERGDGVGTKTIVETEHDSCACSPLGKECSWWERALDDLHLRWAGRVVSVAHPNTSGTSTLRNADTTYSYNLQNRMMQGIRTTRNGLRTVNSLMTWRR